MTPAVSIVIPTFNHARFLGEAIASIRAQTIDPLEVIVVDDGSTDDPAAVVALWPTVRLIRQENQGLAAARNAGWRAARGRYVVFLDADDRLRPRALAANLKRFAREPECAFVYGGYQVIDVQGLPLGPAHADDVGIDAYERFLRGNAVGMHGTMMYRRDRLEEAGGFDPALEACEDYDLMLRLTRRYRVAFSPEIIAEYRWHGENMSEDVPLMLKAALRVLRQQQRYVTGHPGRQAAFAEGLRNLKDFYAQEALLKLYVAMRQRKLGLGRLIAPTYLLVTAPSAFFRVVAREARSRLAPRRRSPPPGRVAFGDLRRLDPISLQFGFDRGRPIDRCYIEGFLLRHAGDIRGRVLEIGDDGYTRRFGGARVVVSDVLHVDAGHSGATLVGDLADAEHLPSDTFDCIILTQTLQFIFDMRRAVATLYRMLKPGGVLLVTVPGVSSIDRGEWGGTWYWSLTPAALERLLREQFEKEAVAVTGDGNILTAIAFLHGLADAELKSAELERRDPHYPVIVAARAVKDAPVA